MIGLLEWIREQLEFKDLPVVVLSTSNQTRDINRAYELGATSCLVKTATFSYLVRTIESVKSHWHETVETRNSM